MVLDASKAFFSLQKSVKLCAFPLELVLDASKTILFHAKMSQTVSILLACAYFRLLKPVKLYAFPLELVLHASKPIFSVLRSVKLSRFIYRNGFGRIQSHFFIAKTSQIVCISSRVGFGRIQNHFIPCQKSVKLSRFI